MATPLGQHVCHRDGHGIHRAHHGRDVWVRAEQFLGRAAGSVLIVDVPLDNWHTLGRNARGFQHLESSGDARSLHMHLRGAEPFRRNRTIVRGAIQTDAQDPHLGVTRVYQLLNHGFDRGDVVNTHKVRGRIICGLVANHRGEIAVDHGLEEGIIPGHRIDDEPIDAGLVDEFGGVIGGRIWVDASRYQQHGGIHLAACLGYAGHEFQ